jgi:membrane-bound ClpP family serine protease
MKETDWRNTLEVAVKGLIIVVAALAGLYVLGWVFQFLGAVLLGVASIIVALLRWLVPVAIIAGVVYFIVTRISPRPPVYSSPASPATTPITQTDVVTSSTVVSSTTTVKPTEASMTVEPASDRLEPDVSANDETHAKNAKDFKKKDSGQDS